MFLVVSQSVSYTAYNMFPLNLNVYDFVVVVDITTFLLPVHGAANVSAGNTVVPISDGSPYTV
jgi:hypothetical protein